MQTIALVDDDRNILTTVSIALEAVGYKVETYTDGASALDGLLLARPSLLHLRHQMPRMDGMKLLRRRHRQKSDLPSYFLTSRTKRSTNSSCLKMGADAPFTQALFRSGFSYERVKAILRRAGNREALAGRAGAKAGSEFSKHAPRWSAGNWSKDKELPYLQTWKGDPETLTVTEFRFFNSLAQRPGAWNESQRRSPRPLFYGTPAYDEQDFLYVKTAPSNSHIKRLRKKFKMVDIVIRHDRNALRRRISFAKRPDGALRFGSYRLGDPRMMRLTFVTTGFQFRYGGEDSPRRGAPFPVTPVHPRPPHFRSRAVFQPYATDRLLQPCRPLRPRRRHPLSEPVPRRSDSTHASKAFLRKARSWLARSCLSVRRHELDHHRSAEAARTSSRTEHHPGAE